MLGLEYNLTCIVMVPIEIEDTVLAVKVVVALCVGERCHYGELGKVEVNLAKEVYQTLDIVLGLVVETKQNCTLNANAIVVVALYTLLDVVRCIVYSLVYIPCSCLCCKVKNLGIVLYGVAYPLLLQWGNGTVLSIELQKLLKVVEHSDSAL